ncbi:uncharacterized protein MONBRDRAFT_17381 [Monosiga brevicollis MX1]|uniref:Uncharacterized protein n=1 Tax=Monosiga brevicollis TaxID=81824 RepID=A9UQW0_MONBE|nr:uncharacterized protein MONBRDRAFT_17381 [Monosiga brevicollis MX1]EDQ92667.1 predicted protein [Monosiga brevicollis MX1]|eukprot:XP_001742429.1 hypothetical protein [Monosiga brevicollis MX1]
MLAGKNILVTGASSGIGLATARVLATHGARVALTGRNEEALRSALKGPGAIAIPGELTKAGECQRVVEAAASALGSLHGLVNCAGVLKGGAVGSPQFNLQNYQDNFAINTQVVFEMMQHAVPHLKATAPGTAGSSIINVTSVNAKQSFAACAAYCASKAAADMLTQCAAVDLAEEGIRVNSVNPGVIVSQLQKRGGLDEDQYAAFLQRSVDVTHPLAKFRGKIGQPEEVGELIAFLMSDHASFITGECIAIDGGRQRLGAR